MENCILVPSVGANLFRQINKQYGRDIAKNVYKKVMSKEFLYKYGKTLSFDQEGVPTYNSIMQVKEVQNLIGDYNTLKALNNQFQPLEDTLNNYAKLLNDAYNFNTNDPRNNDYIAYVNYTQDNKLTVLVRKKNKELLDKFNNQYSAFMLNNKLANMFSSLGVTVGNLTDAEKKAGRIGSTDFNVVKGIANGFSSVIKVANNMEGATALTEEFSHLMVGVFKEESLMQRSLNLLKNNEDLLQEILGDEYEDTIVFHNGNIDLIAEEALGKLLKEHLIEQSAEQPLINRLSKRIISKFKDYDDQEIQDAVIELDSSISKLAKDIVKGNKQITKEDILRSERDVVFNALSDRIQRNMDLLKSSKEVEAKRYKITTNPDTKKVYKERIENINNYLDETKDTVLGLFEYSQTALDELKALEYEFIQIDAKSPDEKFRFLRNVRSYIQSYAHFINKMNDAIDDENKEQDNMFLRQFDIPSTVNLTTTIQDVIKELNNLSTSLARKYYRTSFEAFGNFLKPFMGNNIVIPFGENKGKTIAVEELIKEANSDITFMDRWLDSMADSSDTLLQLFDKAVKQAKDNARMQTINDIKDIQNLMLEAENNGITSFEWMFEKTNDGKKSGNYISEINYAQWEKDVKEFEQYLNDKYGQNPTGQQAQDKINERNAWNSTHTVYNILEAEPNPDIYKNDDYANLTTTQKTILTKFLSLKKRFDDLLPDNKVSRLKAIQIRKEGSQRLSNILHSPSTLIDNIKGAVESAIFEADDDDQLFGEKIRKTITDFDNKEFMTLPILFTNRLKNADELSTDVFATLMQYSYMANTYSNMDQIIDPLEVGRSLIVDNQRKVKETRGNLEIVEQFKVLGMDIKNPIYQNSSNIQAKLNDFFESQVYGRYLKDQGVIDVLGKKANVNKITSLILKGSSLAQLGFNYLANTANVLTGIGMQNIEAAAGEYFNAKELFSADKDYLAELKDFMPELSSRYKTNKLALFDELFDIRQNFKGNLSHNQKKNWLHKLFGADVAFLGQECGDHWLYNRTAIAMAKRKRVLLNGKEMSLWDALKVENKFKGNDKIKTLNINSIKELNGSALNVHKFTREVAHINQELFGIYNDEDSNAANRLALGRLMLQYRKWIKPSLNKRFKAGQYDVSVDKYTEGYYRTLLRVTNQLIRGKAQIGTVWDNLKEHEKSNIIRSLFELFQCLAVYALANWVEWPDNKNRSWGLKFAEYSCKRLSHELGGLTPSFIMMQEQLKTIKQPIPAISVVQNSINLVSSLFDPTDHFDEIQKGPYKGLSTFEKNFIKAPIPGVAQYRQIDKFINELDTSIGFYMKPY